MFNKIVLGLLSHAMDYVDMGKSVHFIDAETGEIIYMVSPAYFARVLAEVKANRWEYAHAH